MKTIIVVMLLITTLKVVSCCYNYSKETELQQKQRMMRLDNPGVPPPPDCSEWYNNGHSKEWAECMRVPYR